MVKNYIKKPEIVQAVEVKFNTDCQQSIIDWVNSRNGITKASKGLDGGITLIEEDGSKIYVSTGKHIILKDNGDFYQCPSDVFNSLYQEH